MMLINDKEKLIKKATKKLEKEVKLGMHNLPKREYIIDTDNYDDQPPSILKYFILTLISITLVILAFAFDQIDFPNLFLNLATEIMGAIIILLIIEKKLKKRDRELIRRQMYKMKELFYIRGIITDNIIMSYLLSNKNIRWKSDYSFIPRDKIEKEILKRKNSFLIIGKAAAGKTTLLQQHFLYLLDIAIKEKKNKIPIFISMTKLYNLDRIDARDIEEFFVSIIRPKIKLSIKQIKKLIRKNRFIFLFDGLDEIHSQYIDKIIYILDKFQEKYPNSQLIIASRPLEDYKHLAKLSVIQVPDLTYEEITNIVSKMKY